MNDKLVDCDLCNTAGTLKKIPANIAVQYRDNSVGKIVDEFIKETKEEVALEKEKLSSEEYNKWFIFYYSYQ